MALALPAILGTFIVALPLGYLAHRLGRRAGVESPGTATSPSIANRVAGIGRAGVVLVSALLYAIPSLALFVVLPLVLGTSILSPINVIIALLLYGIALQTRVVAEAFDGRDGRVAAAADAVGFSSWEKFWTVDLPLAGPAVLAGMRVVSASTLSLVSVGALVGVSSLGNLLTEGFLRSFPTQILTGVLGIVVLSVLFDLVLLAIGWLVMPWRRKAGL
ncbi:ABC transporter permease [Corynebacterium sp.]|uniref:ABC transporter permease n=1 Tax=Corynebacterium sp. TaxID=1720 RepID=UPI002F3F0DC2